MSDRKRKSEALHESVAEMFDGGMDVIGIASELGISATYVYYMLRQLGFQPKRAKILEKMDQAVQDEIITEYQEERLTIAEILTKHKISTMTFYQVLNANGIEIRSRRRRREAIDVAIKMYNDGHKMTSICDDTGVSMDTLYKRLVELGIREPRVKKPEPVSSVEDVTPRTAPDPDLIQD